MKFMASNQLFLSVTTSVVFAMLAACASAPAASPPEPTPAAAASSTPTPVSAQDAAQAEAIAASSLEKKVRDAARGYKTVQKDGKTLYCKRERVIGSTIPTLQCLTEAELRTQVENTEELKGRMGRPRAGPCGSGAGC
jgi:hypothetical protein